MSDFQLFHNAILEDEDLQEQVLHHQYHHC